MSLFDGVRNLIDLPKDGFKDQIDAQGNCAKTPEETHPHPERITPPEQTQRTIEKNRETARNDKGPNPWLSFGVQAAMCVFTAGAFGAAAWYARIASQQKTTMDETFQAVFSQVHAESVSAESSRSASATAVLSLEIAERAYLSQGLPITPLGGFGLLDFPIENSGHVSSHWIALRLEYKRIGVPEPRGPLPETSSFVMRTKREDQVVLGHQVITRTEVLTIAPKQNSAAITIQIPQLSLADTIAVNTGKQFITVGGIIQYDTGFNKSDTFSVCSIFNSPQRTWGECGAGGPEITLTETPSRKTQK